MYIKEIKRNKTRVHLANNGFKKQNKTKTQAYNKIDNFAHMKGYLCYKMITSRNVSSKAQVKNFYFVEKLCSVIKIFKFLYF